MTSLLARPKVVLAVTAPQSLKLMSGFPEYLSRQGWEVHVVVADPPSGTYSDDSGVRVHNVAMERAPSPWRDLRALVEWLRILRSIRPHIVLAGTPKAGMLGMVASRAVRVPARIYMLRGLRLETESGIRAKVLWLMERVTAGAAHSVIAVSPSLRDEFVKQRLAPVRKVVVIGRGSSNGVATGAHVEPRDVYDARRRVDTAEAQHVIGFVGRISEDKGITTLLRAAQLMEKRGDRSTILLVGPEEPQGALARAITTSGISRTAVQWVGAVSDVTAYYKIMDVLCLPTLREGFPNVVLEAAVHAVPAVVTTATGAIDSVVDGETGLTFSPGNAVELAERLSALSNDRHMARQMGRRARSHVERYFARPRVWRGMELELIRVMLARLSAGERQVLCESGVLCCDQAAGGRAP